MRITLGIFKIIVLLTFCGFASCRSYKLNSLDVSHEWEQKIVEVFDLDTTVNLSLVPIVVDSVNNGLYKGYSNKNKNKGEMEYLIKYQDKVSLLRYRKLVRTFNYRFALRKLNQYLSQEQLDEITKLLTIRVNF